MASTYTANDGIEKPAPGSQPDSWGQSLNNNFDLLDQALDGNIVIGVTGAGAVLNVADGASSTGRCRTVRLVGAPGAATTLSIQPTNLSKQYWILNSTDQQINVVNGSGTTAILFPNTSNPLFCDGLGNVVKFNDFVQLGNVTITGTLGTGFLALPLTSTNSDCHITVHGSRYLVLGNMAFVDLSFDLVYSAPASFFYMTTPLLSTTKTTPLCASAVGGPANIPPATSWIAAGGGVIALAILPANITTGITYTTNISGWFPTN